MKMMILGEKLMMKINEISINMVVILNIVCLFLLVEFVLLVLLFKFVIFMLLLLVF